MSGIEVAGLVLGVLPIVLMSLDLSKAGAKRSLIPFRRRAYVDRLARALLLLKQTLLETVRAVLLASGCDAAWELDNDPLKCLKDKQVDSKILDFLGSENQMTFTGLVEQNFETVKGVCRSIGGLLPGVSTPSDNLSEIIRHNLDAKFQLADLKPRIKLMLTAPELKRTVQELDNATESLDRFMRIVIANRQSISNDPSRKAVKLAKALRQVNLYAAILHTAIHAGWKDGCHPAHDASLFLDDRVDSAGTVSKVDVKDSARPLLAFDLVFAAKLNEGLPVMHETTIAIFREGTDDAEVKSDEQPSNPQRPRVKFVSKQPGKDAKAPVFSLVDDICRELATAAKRNRRASFALHQKSLNSFNGTDLPHVDCDTEAITLMELLQPDPSVIPTVCQKPMSVSLKLRMRLALRLASSLLQLSNTRWLQEAWSKEMIQFPRSSTNPKDDGKVLAGRPFVSVSFCGKTPSPSCAVTTAEPKVYLLELGILLLELWHRTTLEDRFPDRETHSSYYSRLSLALEWFDDVSDPLPDLYDKAVAACVRGVIGGKAHLSDWDDLSFWSGICADVIEPLSTNCKQWRD